MKTTIPTEVIEQKIYFIRGHKVMLDGDLAKLYGVPTKIERTSSPKYKAVSTRFYVSTYCGRSKTGRGQHLKYLPYAFTEQGVAMLSSALNSERAIEVNILIMRTFVKLREMIASHKDLVKKLDELEKKYDEQFQVVFEAIRQLMAPPENTNRKIGFK